MGFFFCQALENENQPCTGKEKESSGRERFNGNPLGENVRLKCDDVAEIKEMRKIKCLKKSRYFLGKSMNKYRKSFTQNVKDLSIE